MEEEISSQNDEVEKPIPVKIGVISDSMFDATIFLKDINEYAVCTPFGKPSDTVIEGSLENVKCVLLSRHGRLHNIMPSNVNYRANIWALRKLGCTHILVTHTTSSLRENIYPGDIVVPHDMIDNTTRRAQTFYDGAVGSPFGVCHLPMLPSFCERTRTHLITAANDLGLLTFDKGTVLTLEGPRYSTSAENKMFRLWGADLLSMTFCPEAILAKEAGLLYAPLSLVTNKECWSPDQSTASTNEIIYTYRKQVEKLQKILVSAIINISQEDWSKDVLKAKVK